MGKLVKEFIGITENEKRVLLEVLGYIEKENLLFSKKTGKPYICPYSREKVHFNTATIIPGSLIIINGDPLSLANYLESEEA